MLAGKGLNIHANVRIGTIIEAKSKSLGSLKLLFDKYCK